MFKLETAPRFTHGVTVQVPVDGGFEGQTFKATYQTLGIAELAQYDFNDDAQGATSTAFLRKVLVGFEDVQGDDGQVMPYSDRARDALIDMPFVRVPLTQTYFAAVSKAQLGN
ncbi:hypothetical protein [Sphingomonas sp. CROZ-RG-20F-R02-07]|uniref:hypothetical protein n=1 Tax=Sphingomonas sp. CROZ-RG-20F-R02-07 TaxID=2914832 RepID=UPI001F59DF8D|nr:hypothetical protein [Sphingomonas sp. CROZ-RG-20F-R02-07]